MMHRTTLGQDLPEKSPRTAQLHPLLGRIYPGFRKSKRCFAAQTTLSCRFASEQHEKYNQPWRLSDSSAWACLSSLSSVVSTQLCFYRYLVIEDKRYFFSPTSSGCNRGGGGEDGRRSVLDLVFLCRPPVFLFPDILHMPYPGQCTACIHLPGNSPKNESKSETAIVGAAALSCIDSRGVSFSSSHTFLLSQPVLIVAKKYIYPVEYA